MKHLADEKDEEGEDIYVYSIVKATDYKFYGKMPDSQDSLEFRDHLPRGMFEEVADNWYELLGSEEDLTKKYDIEIYERPAYAKTI